MYLSSQLVFVWICVNVRFFISLTSKWLTVIDFTVSFFFSLRTFVYFRLVYVGEVSMRMENVWLGVTTLFLHADVTFLSSRDQYMPTLKVVWGWFLFLVSLVYAVFAICSTKKIPFWTSSSSIISPGFEHLKLNLRPSKLFYFVKDFFSYVENRQLYVVLE